MIAREPKFVMRALFSLESKFESSKDTKTFILCIEIIKNLEKCYNLLVYEKMLIKDPKS
jgi:hypothetical protein